jgi:hypothetical protein
VFLGLNCFVLCKSQNKMKPENNVPLNFRWLETNVRHLVFDFTSVTDLMRQGVFAENSLCYTFTVQIEV